jgi:hypothetical protein
VKLAAAALVVLAVTSVMLYPLCHQVFRCGCETMWGAAGDHCNIRAKQGEHCPWCEDLRLGALGFGLTLALQAGAFVLVRSRTASLGSATIGALVALPLAVLVAAAVCWLVTDYPHLVAKDARSRLGIPAGPIRTVR